MIQNPLAKIVILPLLSSNTTGERSISILQNIIAGYCNAGNKFSETPEAISLRWKRLWKENKATGDYHYFNMPSICLQELIVKSSRFQFRAFLNKDWRLGGLWKPFVQTHHI